MKPLILDGSHAGDPLSETINQALRQRLPQAETIVLREQTIGNCAGDFFCWVRSPGVCNTDDDNRRIAARIANTDLLVYLTPVTFGGYSSTLKRMVDHQIQNVLPFFTSIQGQVHHQPRYARYPALLVIGWMDRPEARAEAVFRQLVRRNAINLHAPTCASGLFTAHTDATDLSRELDRWLEQAVSSRTARGPALAEPAPDAVDPVPVRRAVLLVGSPRTRKSTSASLGGYLLERLAARGVETVTIQVYTAFNHPDRTRAALAAIDAADLVLLAFPLYVDSLPAPLIAALERIAAHRREHPAPQRCAVIVNCGFPEASHNDTAAAICAQFAHETGLGWLGSLALGGGEGIVHGMPLAELDGRADALKRGLDLAAGALADGRPVPQAARDLLARPVTPNWVYKLIGGIGWRRQAGRYGVTTILRRKPYIEADRP